MPLTSDQAAPIVAACAAGAREASSALSRALDGQLTLSAAATAATADAALASLGAQPGLLIVLEVADQAAVFAISEGSGLLPAWYCAPDATGTSKLATLAQELGMLLLPEDLMPDNFTALAVKDLTASLARGGVDATAAALPCQLTSATQESAAWLIWPAAQPKQFADPPAASSPAPAAASAPAASRSAAATGSRTDDLEAALPSLPNYTRSLLKIQVPLVVTLAKSRQPLSRIIDLAPGSIIPFDKSCDDMLTLEVNNRTVAAGEAVKVGDKFGLRITTMTLPPERFVPLKRRR